MDAGVEEGSSARAAFAGPISGIETNHRLESAAKDLKTQEVHPLIPTYGASSRFAFRRFSSWRFRQIRWRFETPVRIASAG